MIHSYVLDYGMLATKPSHPFPLVFIHNQRRTHLMAPICVPPFAGRSRIVPIAVFLLAAIWMSFEPLRAQQRAKPVDWSAFRFLVGEWVGEGGGGPGQGTGGFTFAFDLQNTILVRKNNADYPASKDQPAFSHTDLMVIYGEGEKFRAVYFDNEQHVINYTVSFSKDSSAVIFVSDVMSGTPRFRLTNTKQGTDSMKIAFEIAPPGQPEAFNRYVDAVVHRKK